MVLLFTGLLQREKSFRWSQRSEGSYTRQVTDRSCAKLLLQKAPLSFQPRLLTLQRGPARRQVSVGTLLYAEGSRCRLPSKGISSFPGLQCLRSFKATRPSSNSIARLISTAGRALLEVAGAAFGCTGAAGSLAVERAAWYRLSHLPTPRP